MRGGATWQVIGLAGYASYALASLCARWRYVAYHRQHIVAVPLSAIPPMPRGYSGRSLTLDDLTPHRIDADRETQAERFAQGMVCLGLFDRHQALVGVTWIVTGRHCDPETGVDYILPADAAWDAGLWIREDKRLSRAFVGLWALVGQWLEQRGLRATISSIADYNVASITAHDRMGAHRLRQVCVLRVGRLRLAWRARPWIGMRGRALVVHLKSA